MSTTRKPESRYEIKATNNSVEIRDNEKIEIVSCWRSGEMKWVPEPRRVGYVRWTWSSQCCGVMELGNFKFDDDLPDELYDNFVMKVQAKLKRQSMIQAFFVRLAPKKEYDNHHLMDALLRAGWQKLGPEFYNRRYKEHHILQGLVYIFQKGKKGNCYAQTNEIPEYPG